MTTAVKLTKAQSTLFSQLNSGGFRLVVAGVAGKYTRAVLSPIDSDPTKKDSRRRAVNASTVNKLYCLGLIKEKKVVLEGSHLPSTYAVIA